MANIKIGTIANNNSDGTKEYIYPRTDASAVKFGDSTVEAKLNELSVPPPSLLLIV